MNKAEMLFEAVNKAFPVEARRSPWSMEQAEDWMNWIKKFNSWEEVWNEWGKNLSTGSYRTYIAKTAWAIHSGIYNTKLYRSLA